MLGSRNASLADLIVFHFSLMKYSVIVGGRRTIFGRVTCPRSVSYGKKPKGLNNVNILEDTYHNDSLSKTGDDI